MAFGFGNFDLGFSEMNPFGLRGKGIDYSRRDNSKSFQAPIQRGIEFVAGKPAYASFGLQSPAYSPSTGQPNFNTNSAPRARTVSSAPRAAVITSKPRPGATTQAQRLQAATPKQRQTSEADDMFSQIDDLYRNTTDFLGQQRSNIENSQGDILGAIGSQFDAQRPFLDQARDELVTQNQSQQDEARRQEQNALAEARALFGELQQGSRQRFGGTSSVGEFAGAIQGRELQRGQNRISNTAQQNLGALQQQSQSIQKEYQNKVQQLEASRQAALSEARQQFQERLAQIDSVRAQTEDAKTAQKLQALQELNNRAREIENFRTQLEANLQTQALSAAQNIYSAIQSYRAEQGQPVDLSELPGAEFSSILGGTESAVDTLFPTGLYRKPEEEPFNPNALFAPVAA